jgi:hypothetical protein
LSKLNSILIIMCISLSYCSDRHMTQNKKSDDFYLENDQYLNKIENPIETTKASTDNNPHVFIEKNNPKKVDKDIKKIENKSKGTSPIKEENKSKGTSPIKPVKKENKSQKSTSIIKVNKLRNPKITQFEPKHIKEEKCSIKTGYLYIKQDSSNIPITLDLMPVYISLSLTSFNLFLSTDAKSLFNSLKLKDILRISQQSILKDQHCFDLIVVDNTVKQLYKGDVTLCADDDQTMKGFINAIQTFKECQIDVRNVNKNNEILVDFNKVNELLKSKTVTPSLATKTVEAMKPLFYDNTLKTVQKSPTTIKEDVLITKTVKNIVEKIRTGNIQRNQLQRKMKNKLKEAKKFAEEIHHKQELIKQMVEKRMEQEKQKESNLIKIEQKSKELELLKAVQHKIVNMEKKEINQFKKEYKREIVAQKQKANIEAQGMMRIVLDEEKLTPYDQCTDDQLLNFENQEFVRKTCMIYYGENKVNECQIKENFCMMCCAHHVGIKHVNELINCKSTCSGLLKGKLPQRITRKRTVKTVKTKSK